MRVFLDTSSLFKKYCQETGSDKLYELLEDVKEIVLSPVTVLEVHSTLERRLRDKTLSKRDANWILKEFETDCDFFGVVQWGDALLAKSIQVIRKYQLKTLDGIQLASSMISGSVLFVTSDKKLFDCAHREGFTSKYV